MQKVYQRGNYDCFNTCIATLTGISIDKIPLFVRSPDNWLRNARRWLRRRGFILSNVLDVEDLDGRRNNIVATDPYRVDGVFAAHSVVARGLRVVHDPMRRKPKKNYEIVCGWEITKL
jgi:hypothetical protein